MIQPFALPLPPRAVPGTLLRQWAGRNAFWLLFGGIWFLVGTVLFLGFGMIGGFPWTDRQLNSQGVKTRAAVLSVELNRSIKVGNDYPWKVRYRFRDRLERVYEGTGQTFDTELAGKLQQTKTATILYLPEDPRVSKLAGTPYHAFPLFAFLLAGFFGLVGATCLGIGLWFFLRRVWIYRLGLATQATITGSRRAGYQINNRHPYYLSYRFRDRLGRQQESRDLLLDPDEAASYSVGGRALVLYLPDRQGFAMLAGPLREPDKREDAFSG